MEFHISREIRDRLELDELLFSYTGNVVFANVAAARKMAQALNKLREADAGGTLDPERTIHAGALYAMGMIDELNHALVARFRREKDPEVLRAAVRWLTERADPEQVEKLLQTFTERFPNTTVYRGKMTAAEWLAKSTEEMPNREAAVEELLLLWLANINPAFKPFRELYSDASLREADGLCEGDGDAAGVLQDAAEAGAGGREPAGRARAPMKASPDSLTGQLDFIREHWTPYLGEDLKRVLLAIDTLREEDLAIWMMFHPPGPDWHRHGPPGRGGAGVCRRRVHRVRGPVVHRCGG